MYRESLYEQIAVFNRWASCERLKKAGFVIIRQKGSHVYLRDATGRSTVVPVHRGESLGKGLLKKILHDTELENDELIKLLH